jgi:hypothetical protein
MKTQTIRFQKKTSLYLRLIIFTAAMLVGWTMLSSGVVHPSLQSGGNLQFLSETLAINEVNGTVSLAVTRTGGTAGAVSVQYTMTAGTATSGENLSTPSTDFISTSGTLTFGEGETTKTISISINADSTTEPDETFTVSLSTALGGAVLGAPSTVTVTIVDPRSTTQPGRILSSPRGIVEFNTDGSNTVSLTADSTQTSCPITGGYTDSHPSVSRDGRLIAFASNRDGTGYRIFVMNHDGTNLRQVTFNPGPNPDQPDDVDQDVNPVISPDGTRIAFISGRTVLGSEAGPCAGQRISDAWIVNTDGTGLTRVAGKQYATAPNPDRCVGLRRIVSVVWNPANSNQLAIRGHQSVTEGNPSVEMWPQAVSINGGDVVATFGSTGMSASLDWSPNGRYIGFIFGREAQGAPPRRVVILDLNGPRDENGRPLGTGLLQDENTADNLRFSPDSQRFVVGITTDFNFGAGVLAFFNLNGSGRADTPRPNHTHGTPIWWQPGAPIPAPARLELAPDPVTIWRDHNVQMQPVLYDANGNTIVRAATAWRLDNCSGGSARLSHTGQVIGRSDINYTGQVCASNGGLDDCVTLQQLNTPILSVTATTPETARSNTGAPGVFTITRAGNSTGGLAIPFTLGGAAVRDVDYFLESSAQLSGNTVIMNAGVTSVTINVRPISNSPNRGNKTVDLTLQPDPSNYIVGGQAGGARVVIRDDTNPGPFCAPTPSGLTNWYRAEGDANDFVGTRHGSLRGGAGFALGLVGQAFRLDGADDDVDLGNLSPGSQWTVEAWVNPSATPSGRRAILGGFAECNDWGITMENGQFGVVVKPPSGCTQTISSGVTAQAGQWYHVVATSDGTTARIYVNGQERASGAVAANYVGFAGSVRIGSEACCGNNFPGLIDEASIYSRALSPSEVQAIHASGFDGKCTIAPTPTPTPSATPTPTPAPGTMLTRITPNRGGDAGSVTLTVFGQNIQQGATVRLARAGQTDIAGTGVSVAPNSSSLTATFNLTGRAQGAWDVIVTSPGGATTLAGAFTIEANQPAEVWVDIIGRYTIRGNVRQTYYIAYGNNGNVDAPATLLRVFIPMPITVNSTPLIAGSDPSVVRGEQGTTLEYLVPNVPAGSSSFAPLMLTAPATGRARLHISAISVPGYEDSLPEIDTTLTSSLEILEESQERVRMRILTTGASGTQEFLHDATFTPVDAPMEPTATEVQEGENLVVTLTFTIPASGQSSTPTRTNSSSNPSATPNRNLFFRIIDRIVATPESWRKAREVARERRAAAELAVLLERRNALLCLRSKGVLNDRDISDILALTNAETVTSFFARPYIQYPAKLTPAGELVNGLATAAPGLRNSFWRSLKSHICGGNLRSQVGNHPELAAIEDQCNRGITGEDSYYFELAVLRVCAPCGRGQQGQSQSRNQLRIRPLAQDQTDESCPWPPPDLMFDYEDVDLNIVISWDPNEKGGSQGSGSQHFISGEEQLRYVVFFENLATATAPAQEVVITDQLDVSRFDLSTFQLGPIAFGNRTVTPPSGLSQWTTDVDLRPANNLIVRINAGLNQTTGLVTWRFTSLDPQTMQPTDDPLAGFLPPNRTSPEGEGNVFFTVMPKTALQTGTEIRNGARIVFDANEHIDTPVWLNTIDNSRPQSRAAAFNNSQPSLAFFVNWTGTDTGSGVESYTVMVSENGGAYTPWLSNTTSTSAMFSGRAGVSYSFYTLARDRAGNVETGKTVAEATITTPNVIGNSIDDISFFVRQHYLDFLEREPEPDGFAYWTNLLRGCNSDRACLNGVRVEISSRFFAELEFQRTGYYVMRLWRASYGNFPNYQQFLADRRQVQNNETSQRAFAAQFVTRQEFLSRYLTTLTAEQFVTQLYETAGANSSTPERQAHIQALQSGQKTRADILHEVVNLPMFGERTVVYNSAWVRMQYFGYLRRDAEAQGEAYWTDVINNRSPNNYQAMICAFLNSAEYHRRFSEVRGQFTELDCRW